MNEIKLSEFIKNTIIEIVEGVENAKKELGDKVLVNPHINKEGNASTSFANQRKVQNIEFNLNITAGYSENNNDQSKKGVSLKVVSLLGVNIGGEKTMEDTNYRGIENKIKFSIPISLNPNTTPSKGSGVKVSSF